MHTATARTGIADFLVADGFATPALEPDMGRHPRGCRATAIVVPFIGSMAAVAEERHTNSFLHALNNGGHPFLTYRVGGQR